jgi:magnesium transporter
VYEGPGNFTWLDVSDPATAELEELSDRYRLNPYTLRDCLEPDHLPKHEWVNDVHFIIARRLTGETEQKADSIQEMSDKVAIFYSDAFIITIHRNHDHFLHGKEKAAPCRSTGQAVTMVLWKVLNSYDKPGLRLSAQIDRLEREVFLRRAGTGILEELYYIKRKASVCYKLLVLTAEAINAIRSVDPVALQDLRDLHVRQVHLYGQVNDDVSSLLNVYLSLSSQRTSDVMKVLTVFSAFFLPITFIAGVYGMNFALMPELEMRWGYPASLLLMALTTAAIYFWFRRKGWLR